MSLINKTVLEWYDMENQKLSMPNYQKLKTMVKRSIDQKLRLRNFDARHEKIETGAVVKSHRGLSGIERGKGICYQWREKGQCSKGDQCSFRHESNDRAKPTPKTAPPSEPPTSKTRGRSASRKRNVRGRSHPEKFNRQPCKYFLKGACTKSSCEYWHPPNVSSLKRNWDVSSALSAHSLTGRLKSHRTQKPKNCDDKSAVATVELRITGH